MKELLNLSSVIVIKEGNSAKGYFTNEDSFVYGKAIASTPEKEVHTCGGFFDPELPTEYGFNFKSREIGNFKKIGEYMDELIIIVDQTAEDAIKDNDVLYDAIYEPKFGIEGILAWIEDNYILKEKES